MLNNELNGSKSELLIVDSAPDNTGTSIEPKSCVSDHFYSFAYKIIKTGAQFPYQLSMLYKVDDDYIQCDKNKDFDAFIDSQLSKNGAVSHWALYWYVRRFTVTSFFLKLAAYIILAIIPFYLQKLIRWLEDENATPYDGYYYVGVMTLAMIAKTAFNTRSILNNMKARAFISNALGVSLRIY